MAIQKPISATGRRKTSTARVYLTANTTSEETNFTVNGRSFFEYFPRKTTQMIVKQPIELTQTEGKFDIKASVGGGGLSGQAGAVLHGLSRALEKVDPALRAVLKKAGFLTRDSRAVERKKPGRHKARKRPQFSKR